MSIPALPAAARDPRRCSRLPPGRSCTSSENGTRLTPAVMPPAQINTSTDATEQAFCRGRIHRLFEPAAPYRRFVSLLSATIRYLQ
jgi:hypothetical protein